MIDQLKQQLQDLAASYKQIMSAKVAELKSGAAAPAQTIKATVGKGGKNDKADVLVVQELLNKFGYKLTVDGDCGNKSIVAITDFQVKHAGLATGDGLISPNGQTWKALVAGAAPVVPTITPNNPIKDSVGEGGKNDAADVITVQKLLNKVGYKLPEDGKCGADTIAAIKDYQAKAAGSAHPDGRIDAGGGTWKTLLSGKAPATTIPTTPTTNTTTPTTLDQQTQDAISPTSTIKNSVGQGGKNDAADVMRVQALLNQFGNKLTVNGQCGADTITAIKAFQTKYRGDAAPDGRVDAGGKTWNALLGIGRIQGDLVKMAQQFGVEPAVVLTVQSVESGGNGFFADGRPKILFEGHIFWSQLQKAGKDPNKYVKGNENILFPKWDKTKYAGGVAEYDRLEQAKKIDEIAALKSASWGEFQIMGFNHASVGYTDVVSFVEAMKKPGGNSLKAVLEFMKSNGLIKHVQGAKKDWAAFAKGYNGPAYADNQYDTKLAAAYERFKDI